MGQIRPARPALLLFAAFSRHEEALTWGRERAEQRFGPIALASEPFAFRETDYYEATMGADLLKCFWALEPPIDPAVLPDIKHQANRWEEEYAAEGRHNEPRPLNLDPGYLTEAKLVLASTKDHAHRVYLRDGVYAEVTLHYQHGGWRHREWTFPDYRRADYHRFFDECREHLRDRRRQGG